MERDTFIVIIVVSFPTCPGGVSGTSRRAWTSPAEGRAFCIKASGGDAGTRGRVADGRGRRDSRCEQIENRLAF